MGSYKVIDYCKYHKDKPPEEIQKPVKSTNLMECGILKLDTYFGYIIYKLDTYFGYIIYNVFCYYLHPFRPRRKYAKGEMIIVIGSIKSVRIQPNVQKRLKPIKK